MRSWTFPFGAAAAVILVFLVAGCGGGEGHPQGSHDQAQGDPSQSLVRSRFSGTLASPRRLAPPLRLRSSLGRPVDLERYRGDAVVVTFVYVHCPDICPLMINKLGAALSELGPAADKVHVIAVSVDPEGDTPAAVNRFLAAHRVRGRITYLIGSRPRLERIWHEWNIVAERSPDSRDPDRVEHSAMVYGIDARGLITTLYPSSFEPEQVAHDVPILAAG